MYFHYKTHDVWPSLSMELTAIVDHGLDSGNIQILAFLLHLLLLLRESSLFQLFYYPEVVLEQEKQELFEFPDPVPTCACRTFPTPTSSSGVQEINSTLTLSTRR